MHWHKVETGGENRNASDGRANACGDGGLLEVAWLPLKLCTKVHYAGWKSAAQQAIVSSCPVRAGRPSASDGLRIRRVRATGDAEINHCCA